MKKLKGLKIMKTIKLLRNLAKLFPKSIRSHGDYCGLMTGKLKEDTNAILLCLDFDDIVYEKMIENGYKPDLILTHHPYIYGTRYRVLKKDPIKKALTEKIDALDIPVYSMHTNFDTGKNGMNDALSAKLGLVNVKPLETCKMARGGYLKNEMEIHGFAKYVNKCFGIEYSHLISAGKQNIKSVAILGGGGSYKYINALNEGYDIFISGDVPHHIRRDVILNHYNFLDCSHEIEKIFMSQMEKIIHEIDPSIKIIIVDHEKLPELIS